MELNIPESKKYEDSLRITKILTKEDIEINSNLVEGQEYSYIPPPKNREEAIERFKKLTATIEFERLQKNFIKKYHRINKDIIEDELKLIYDFIDSAKKLSLTDAFNSNKDKSPHLEYLRLSNGYYENEDLPFYDYFYYFNYSNYGGSMAIYGKYFLFKEWLEELSKEYSDKNTDNEQKDNIDTNTGIDIKLLKYLSENFDSTDKRFTELTKYNQIYRFLNKDLEYNIEHRAYKNLVKESFGFDYKNREISEETQKHITQLEKLKKNYNQYKK